jgi:RNA polymerase sigma factor (sigma-70 family)
MEQIEFANKLSNEIDHLRFHAKHFTHDINDADDLIQETSLKALRFWNLFKEGTNFKGWLYTIMRNSFISSYHSQVRSHAEVIQVEDLSSIQLLMGSVSNLAESKIRMDEIASVMNQLKKSFLIPFSMYLNGYKYHEIAELLSVPIGTIKNRIHVAKIILRKNLESGYPYTEAG